MHVEIKNYKENDCCADLFNSKSDDEEMRAFASEDDSFTDIFNLEPVEVIYPLDKIYSICSKYSKECIGIPGTYYTLLNTPVRK